MVRKAKTVLNATRRVFGYARVSTARQVDDGQSLDVQKAQIEVVCRANGWVLEKLFIEEGVSGSIPFKQRPQGCALWSGLQAGDVVVSTKLDRAFRNSADAALTLEALQSMGVDLVLADMGTRPVGEDAAAKLMFGVMTNVATFERARIAERIAETKAYQKARGTYLGGIVPFGFVVEEGNLVADVDLQSYVVEKSKAGLPSRTIVNFLRLDRGIDTTPKTVCKFLRENAAA